MSAPALPRRPVSGLIFTSVELILSPRAPRLRVRQCRCRHRSLLTVHEETLRVNLMDSRLRGNDIVPLPSVPLRLLCCLSRPRIKNYAAIPYLFNFFSTKSADAYLYSSPDVIITYSTSSILRATATIALLWPFRSFSLM